MPKKRDNEVIQENLRNLSERLDRLHDWTQKQEERIQNLDKNQAISREASRNTRSLIHDLQKDFRDVVVELQAIQKEESWKMMKLITWTSGIIMTALSFLKMTGLI